MDSPAILSPVLFSLPLGLGVSGITTWALRLAGGLASNGRRVTIMAHQSRWEPVNIPMPNGVELVRLPELRPATESGGTDSSLHAYLAAIDHLKPTLKSPLIALPSVSVESYGLVAGLTQLRPGLIRSLGWMHNDIAHDYALLTHYERGLSRLVGVSELISEKLHRRLLNRVNDIRHMPYGVPVPSAPSPRKRLDGRPLRLIYTGRIDHFQKRVGVLLKLSQELAKRGIVHELTLVGDGPATDEIDRSIQTRPSIRRIAPTNADVAALLAISDIFVLASRFEGLSISMLEAMAMGCVPIVTQVDSGALEAIESGRSGFLVPQHADDARLAEMMASAIVEALPDLIQLSNGAHQRAAERFSIERHINAVCTVIDEAAAGPARDWPADQPTSGAGFTVPSDAPARALAVAAPLAGCRLAVWGAGRHSLVIIPPLLQAGCSIIAAIDDDPANRAGTIQGLPILSAKAAAEAGVTDVVISSAIHEDALWMRRDEMQSIGLRVHRIYG